MRTLFGLLLVLGVAGFLLYRYVLPSSEKRSCERLAELCGRPTANVDRCVADMSALGKTSQEAVTRFDGCVAEGLLQRADAAMYEGKRAGKRQARRLPKPAAEACLVG